MTTNPHASGQTGLRWPGQGRLVGAKHREPGK
jgi:hypothetical protein